jgi:hypothetical protein
MSTSSLLAADAVSDSCNAISEFVDVSFCAARHRAPPHGREPCRGERGQGRPGHRRFGGWRRRRHRGTDDGRDDPAAGDALRACAYLYVAASVPALRLMRGYTAARSWSAARALLLLLLTGQAGIGCECDVAVEGIAAAVASVVSSVDGGQPRVRPPRSSTSSASLGISRRLAGTQRPVSLPLHACKRTVLTWHYE